MGNTAKADSLFLVVQQKYPGSPSAIQSAFEMAFDAEKRADTVIAMQRYIALSEAYPDTEYGARSRYRVGMHYRSLRQFDTAITHFAIVAQRSDELGAEALYRVGEMYLRTDSLQAAVTTFLAMRDRFSRIEDWHTLAMMNLGEVYQRLNQINEAKEIYRLVITIRKEDDFGKEAEERLKKLQKL
jgi:TolA-binding protein